MNLKSKQPYDLMEKGICFTVVENGSEHTIKTHEAEYRNLMFLLKDQLFLDGFGECGGVGRCATCIIRATGVAGDSAVKDRNEPVTLSKMGYEKEEFRLSCQLFLSPDLDGAIVEVIEQ